MEPFSIELAAERIHDPRTRRYFDEVRRCYTAQCYRASVVALWSVVVCDVFYKLQGLADTHGDKTAESILKEVEKTRKNNPRSPEWEIKLIDRVTSQTHLLDAAEKASLDSLYAHRNLSAHPVLTVHDEALYSPNRDTVRAHIRNALESILTKPPLLTKRAFDAFMEDLAALGSLKPSRDNVRKHIEARFLPYLPKPVVLRFMRSLWKLVFRGGDARCKANRRVNYLALRALAERYAEDFLDSVRNDQAYYSNIALTGTRLSVLTTFLGEFPEFYELLEPAKQDILKEKAEESTDQAASSWFISGKEAAHHLESILEEIRDGEIVEPATFRRLVEFGRENECEEQALRLGIVIYGHSPSYDSADSRFEDYVASYFDRLREFPQLLLELAGEVESNSQTYARRNARTDHRRVHPIIEETLGDDFPAGDFPKFMR